MPMLVNHEGEEIMFEDIQTHCQTRTHIRGINHIYLLTNSLKVIDNSFVQLKENSGIHTFVTSVSSII